MAVQKQKKLLLRSLIICFIITNTSFSVVSAQISSNDRYNVLFLVSYGYGDNYYDLETQFSEWNWTMEVAGPSVTVRGCSNHHSALSLETNLTFDELDRDKIKEYDCIIIPSGGHWNSLIMDSSVEEIVLTAHKHRVILGTLCIGQKILSDANGLMDGVQVAYFSMTYQDMQRENAEIVYEDVVTDKNVVTGGGGGSLIGGGHTVAPTQEFCEAVRDAIKARNDNTLIYSIIGSGGVFVLLAGGFILIKKKPHLFSKKIKNQFFFK